MAKLLEALALMFATGFMSHASLPINIARDGVVARNNLGAVQRVTSWYIGTAHVPTFEIVWFVQRVVGGGWHVGWVQGVQSKCIWSFGKKAAWVVLVELRLL